MRGTERSRALHRATAWRQIRHFRRLAGINWRHRDRVAPTTQMTEWRRDGNLCLRYMRRSSALIALRRMTLLPRCPRQDRGQLAGAARAISATTTIPSSRLRIGMTWYARSASRRASLPALSGAGWPQDARPGAIVVGRGCASPVAPWRVSAPLPGRRRGSRVGSAPRPVARRAPATGRSPRAPGQRPPLMETTAMFAQGSSRSPAPRDRTRMLSARPRWPVRGFRRTRPIPPRRSSGHWQ